MRLLLPVLLFLGLLGHPGGASASAEAAPTPWITPEMAVLLASDAGPSGVTGVFVLRVQGTGAQDDRVYLNSRADYRDPLNLTVALSTRAAAQLSDQLGDDPPSALVDRFILVRGTAIRTRIDFLVDGEVTGKFYYQTHVNVVDVDQILVDPALDAPPSQGVTL